MKPIETQRLILRDYLRDDLPAIHHILDQQLLWAGEGVTPESRWERIRGHQLNQQSGFGPRAIVLKSTGQLVGYCILHCRIELHGQFPSLERPGVPLDLPDLPDLRSSEISIGYAIAPEHQGNGYASEAAKALADYAFAEMNLWRIVSLTDRDNRASVRVMEKIGMRIERNRNDADWPAWAGILYHPRVVSGQKRA